MLLKTTARLVALSFLVCMVAFNVACRRGEPAPDEGITQAPQETRTVVLYQYRFNPNSLTVPSGTTVTFQNRDTERHNINIPALNVDQSVDPNGEWSYTFNTTGEFAVSNRFQDGMRLNLTVQ
jgi:plastocyanin